MATIVTRETGATAKNSVLTNQELDQNFININTDKLELAQTYSSAVASAIPYFNTTKVLVTSSTLIIDGTNIGLGTTPQPYTVGNRVFEINGLSNNSEIRLTNTATGNALGSGGLSLRQVSHDSFIWNAGTGKLSLGAGNQSRLEISAAGAVTVGGNAVVTVGDVGTVTNTMLAGSISNSKLANSSVTVGTTSISLGSSSTTLTGLTSVTSTSFVGALTGNASTATTLATARNINGVSFNGSSDITVADSTKLPLAGGTLTGQVILNTTGTANSPSLRINTSTSGAFVHTQENLAANLTAGQTAINVVGQAGSTKNSGYIGYNWAGAASNSNYVSIGHWGADHLLRVYGDGVVVGAGNAIQAGTAFNYDNPGGWGANLVAAGTNHARVRLRATSFNSSGDRETYLWLDNTVSPATGMYSNATTFNFNGSISTVQVNGNTVLHAGNYNSYSPTLTGGGASGTWGINVTGTANNITAYTINQSVGTDNAPTFSEVYTNGWFRNNESGEGLYNQATGNHWYSDSGSYWNMGGGVNGSGIRFRDNHAGTIRGYVYYDQSNNIGFLNNGGSWRARVVGGDYWLVEGSSIRAPLFYDSGDTNYYWDPGASSAHRLNTPSGYLDLGPMNTSHCHFQTDRSNFYFNTDLQVNGTIRHYNDTSNRFGIGSLVLRSSSPTVYLRDTDHNTAMLHCNSNTFYVLRGGTDSESWSTVGSGWWPMELNLTNNNASFGGGVTAAYSFYGQTFYERENSAYYCDPAGNSYLYGLILSGGSYFRPQNWIQMDGNYGMYWPNTGFSGAPHIYPNTGSTYTQLRLDGYKNSYGGIWDSYSAVNIGMFDGGGNGGVYREANGRWYTYYHLGNDCLGIGTSGTSSSYGIYCGKGIYANGRHDGTIFYDSENTGYYVDPNSYSYVYSLRAASYLASSGNIYTDSNYGYGLVGVYASTRYQGVFAMGDSYKLPADGTTTGSLYGIAWSHPNAGGTAGNLNTHGALILENGSFLAALSGSIRCRDDMRAPLYYDSNDTGYYCDPASTNRLNFVNSNNHYIQPGYMLYSDHGSWQGEYNKIQWHANHLYLQNNGGGYLLILRRGDGGERFYCDYSGNVTASGNITAYSDISLKRNVQTIKDPISIVNRLRGVTFDWIDTGLHSYGLIAQEVEKVLPELVLETNTGTTDSDIKKTVKSVDYSKIVSVLIEAIKYQQALIKGQEDRLARLEKLLGINP